MAVCECSCTVMLRCRTVGLVIVADTVVVEVVVFGREGLQALSQASCVGTPCTAHFLPA